MKLCYKCNNSISISSDIWECNICGTKPDVKENFFCFAPQESLNNDLFNSEDFKLLFELEEKHFWFRSRNRLINWAINKFFFMKKNFLEIGCGTGYVLSNIQRTFPYLNTRGADIYVQALPFAKKRLRPETHLFQMDARNIPYLDEFDVIGAFDVLEHIVEDQNVLNQINRSLKKDGGLLLTVPQHPWLWSASDNIAYHKRRYKCGELEEKLKSAGFSVKLSTSFVFLLLPLMLFSRCISKNNYNPKTELIINPFINFILEAILYLETKLISLGCKFPIGGTRFIVAMKN